MIVPETSPPTLAAQKLTLAETAPGPGLGCVCNVVDHSSDAVTLISPEQERTRTLKYGCKLKTMFEG